jgi:uncharacterized protein DUF3300
MTQKLLSLLCFLCFMAHIGLADELYSADELDELVGPVALYPDPLLTQVLTGATQPDQIQQAQAYLDAGKPVTDDMNTGFDSAVNALLFYPDVLSMMNQNTEWTNAIGWASANQLSDVMEAVQRFRYLAKTAGSLKSNDKVKVIEEGTVIRVEPADPQIIYVPTYQPATVIVQQPSGFDTFLRYSAGIATSVLLWNRVFDYHNYRIYPTPYGWRPNAGYYRPYGGTAVFNRNVNVWAPNRNTVINRPVNISNNNFQNINNRSNRVSNSRPTQLPANRVQPRNNAKVSQPRPATGRRPGARPPIQTPTTNRPAATANTNRSNSGRSGMSNYSRTSGTVRSSNRGAQSRGSKSHVGSGNRGTRTRSGGRSPGGRRR